MSEWVDAPTGPGRWWRCVGGDASVLCDVDFGEATTVTRATRVDGLEVLYSTRPFAGVKWRRDVPVSADEAERVRAMDLVTDAWRLMSERALRAERERDDLAATLETRNAEHALAMERVREIEAIIAGRTTPPTGAEIAAHAGAWLVVGRGLALALSRQNAADCACNARALGAEWRWLPIADNGRPCAWPTVEVSRG